jgi:hypothetical protein
MTKSDPTRLPSLAKPADRRPLAVVGGAAAGDLLIEVSPLHPITSSHQAMILFYLISGCVLYLSGARRAVIAGAPALYSFGS